MSDRVDRAAVAERAARAGGETALESYRGDPIIETKGGKTDLVTAADRASQDRAVSVIESTFPDDPIVGEESGTADVLPTDGTGWVIDPIDGTGNFVRELPLWVTSVTAIVEGEPVAAANVLPALDESFVAGPDSVIRDGEPIHVSDRTDPETFAVAPLLAWSRSDRGRYGEILTALAMDFGDIRKFGSAQFTLSLVAAGALDAAVTDRVGAPWDTIAGVHMIRNAGGIVTDREGNPWAAGAEGLVASNGHRHDQLLSTVRSRTG